MPLAQAAGGIMPGRRGNPSRVDGDSTRVAATSGMGIRVPPGMPRWPASHRALGRDRGSVDSAAVTNGSSRGGIPSSSGFPSITRKKIVW